MEGVNDINDVTPAMLEDLNIDLISAAFVQVGSTTYDVRRNDSNFSFYEGSWTKGIPHHIILREGENAPQSEKPVNNSAYEVYLNNGKPVVLSPQGDEYNYDSETRKAVQ